MPTAMAPRTRHACFTIARWLLQRTVRVGVVLSLAVGALCATLPTHNIGAQEAPLTERPVAFDSAGRVTVMTPALASRFNLRLPEWPVTGAFREARLYTANDREHVLVVQRTDGSFTRYALQIDNVVSLRGAVEIGVQAQSTLLDRNASDASDAIVSAPAGNTFVRNQTILGLIAYGPAAAAISSEAGPAGGFTGYLVAAGASFFISANLVKYRNVSRAQSGLASHAGFRGSLAGVAVGRMLDADGGAANGLPILAAGLTGTVAGYNFARGLSDGEAASSGLAADLAALTTLGLSGALGAFRETEMLTPLLDFEGNPLLDFQGTPVFIREQSGLRGPGKAALGAAIATGVLGYAVGPRYARRADYNVTAGDAKVAFAASLIGAVASIGLSNGDNADEQTAFGLATAGLLGGFLLADRTLVRSADRTAADGSLVQLGTLAGGLIGGGVAAAAEANARAGGLLVAAGGLLGLLAADAIVAPGKDAGPLRGMLPEGIRNASSRASLQVGPLLSALALAPRGAAARANGGVPQLALTGRPVFTPIPVLSIAW